jgi:hypothetical protein
VTEREQPQQLVKVVLGLGSIWLGFQIHVGGEGVTPFVLQLECLHHSVPGEVVFHLLFSGAGTVTLDLDLLDLAKSTWSS